MSAGAKLGLYAQFAPATPQRLAMSEDGRNVTKFRIAIICPDLEGPIRNGGVGTANTALAHLLAGSGHDVHLLLTTPPERVKGDWRKQYEKAGICTYDIESWGDIHRVPPLYPSHPDVTASYVAYLWTQSVEPDLVIVADWKGHGFFVTSAVTSAPVIVVAHGPTLWHDLGNSSLARSADEVLRYFLERKSLQFADAVISPSKYMVEWLANHGYLTAGRPEVVPNPVVDSEDGFPHTRPALIDGITFFGRLEERKGLIEFCDALDILTAANDAPKNISFVGKIGRVGGLTADKYLATRMPRWETNIELCTDFDSSTAISHILRSNSLAVVPSRIDNSPYVIVETVKAQIPLLARDVGGVGELLDADTRDLVLYRGGAPALAAAIVGRLGRGHSAQRLHVHPISIDARWVSKVEQHANARSRNRPETDDTPSISVCLVHHNRPALLKEAVASLFAQSDSRFEVVLVDDGSSSEARAALKELEPEFLLRGWKIVYSENQYLGAARNLAAKYAGGTHLLFMDDDNVAYESMIQEFRMAATRSGAGFIACAFDVFEQAVDGPNRSVELKERFVPLGPSWSESANRNILGDANSLIRADIFHKFGGFTTDRGVGSEDYELFTRLMIEDVKFGIIPNAQFRYRRHDQSMSLQTSRLASEARRVRPFLENLPAHLHELVLAARLGRPRELEGTPISRGIFWNGLPSSLVAQGRDDLAAALLVNWDPADRDAIAGKLALRFLMQLRSNNGVVSTLEERGSALPSERIHRSLRDALRGHRLSGRRLANPVAIVEWTMQDTGSNAAARIEVLVEVILSGTSTVPTKIEHLALGRAVRLASEVYVDRRPDVAGIIDGLNVHSSLDHYERWGRHEGEDWPELTSLILALPDSDSDFWSEMHRISPEDTKSEFERLLRVIARSSL